MAIASRPSSSARAGTLRRRLQPALGVTFWSFVVLGMSDAALGTAWPAIRSSLDLPIGGLGLIQLTGTAGFLTASLVSGRVAAGLGRSGSLLAAAGLAVTGMGLFASAPALGVLLLSALVIGLAGGSIEPGMQSHVTLSSSSRTMNLLHGFYGLGATIGPLLVSGLLLLHASWRFAYLVLLCGEALVGATRAPASPVPRWRAPVSRLKAHWPVPTSTPQ